MGCRRTYEVQTNILSEGNRYPLTTAPEITVGTWSRVADETSIAELIIESSVDCNNFLQQIWPYLGMVEIAIIRDGTLVWSGPIINIAYVSPREPVLITAADISYYTQRRIVDTVITASADPATVAADTLQSVLSTAPATGLDADPGLILDHLDTQTVGTTVDYENDTTTDSLYDILDDLTDYGMTWTVANHRLLLGGRADIDTAISHYVGDDNFTGDIEYEIDLDDVVTYAVAASSDDDTSNQTATIDTAGPYPALGSVIDVGDTTSSSSMQIAAQRALAWPPQPTISAQDPGELIGEFNVDTMIPGRTLWEVGTEFLGRHITQRMVLESLSVVFRDDGTETLSPGFTPIPLVEG